MKGIVTPTGHFGQKSRERLAKWYDSASNHGKKAPCDPSTWNNCDRGAAVPGLNVPGPVKAVLCGSAGTGAGQKVNGKVGLGVGIFCDIVLD